MIAKPVVALALLGTTQVLGTAKELGTSLVYQQSLAAVIEVAPDSPASAPKPRLSVAPPTRRGRRTAQPARHAACCWVHKCALSRQCVPRGGPLGSGNGPHAPGADAGVAARAGGELCMPPPPARVSPSCALGSPGMPS